MQTPPLTRKTNYTDVLHGITIPDPYQWLEDGESAEVHAWSQTQNAYTDLHLKNERFSVFSNELEKDFAFTNFSNPYPVHGNYFYTERKPGEEQPSLYLKKGLGNEALKIIDPNGLTPGSITSLDSWMPSHNARYLAYALSVAGEEMGTMHIRDLESGNDLSEAIPQCRYSQVQWLPDSSGFFYTRHAWPGTVPKNEEHLHEKVYFHRLGQNPEQDPLIFGEGRPKDDMLDIALSQDGKLLVIGAAQNWTKNELYLYDTETKATAPLVSGIEAKFSFFFTENTAVILTNYKADKYRALSLPLSEMQTPIDSWKEIIPEKEYLLQTLAVTKDSLIAEYLKNACSHVVMFDHQGKETGSLPLPDYSSLAGIASRKEEAEFFYGVDSFTRPKVSYRYAPDSKAPEKYRETENPINSENYTVRQEWFSSKDGASVPLFIYHRKDLDLTQAHPTILYGYGGFGNTDTPYFMRSFVPWIERGGIFAIANIRGNAEFGEEWHKAGTKERKQNTFNDFIAAGEFLTQKGYTDTPHLGILGGSNGGLLVAACITQRPDLFGATCSKVPLTDMVRFPQFGMAMRWVHEYGNPEIREELETILKWSPYHNAREHTNYPPTLFTTATKDTRVDPLHARKMAALLQAINTKNPILLFTEPDAGHGPGRPVKKIVENQALVLSFFAGNLQLPLHRV